MSGRLEKIDSKALQKGIELYPEAYEAERVVLFNGLKSTLLLLNIDTSL